MSVIAKALKKAQQTRAKQDSYYADPSAKEIVYLADAPRLAPKTFLLILLAVGGAMAMTIGIAAIMITMKNSELKQNRLLILERSIKAQDKKINTLIDDINKRQSFLATRMADVGSRLDQLSSDQKDGYDNLKEAIIDVKQQIGSLDQSTQDLEQRINSISSQAASAKATTIPSSGN